MTLSSVLTTMPDASNFRYATLYGYKRSFSLISVNATRNGTSRWATNETAALAISPSDSKDAFVRGCVFDIPATQMDAYKEREHRYKLMKVDVFEADKTTSAITVVAQTNDEYRSTMTEEQYHEKVGQYMQPYIPSGDLWEQTHMFPLRGYLEKCILASVDMDAATGSGEGSDGLSNFLDDCMLADGITSIRSYMKSNSERFSSDVMSLVTGRDAS